MSTQGSNVVDIIALLQGNNPSKAEIVEQAQSTPLRVSQELRGNAGAEAGVALDMGWNSAKGSVRIVVSGRVECDSNPETHLKAYEHIYSVVTAVIADKLPELQELMEAVNKVDVGG
jgi:hypothetical protein